MNRFRFRRRGDEPAAAPPGEGGDLAPATAPAGAPAGTAAASAPGQAAEEAAEEAAEQAELAAVMAASTERTRRGVLGRLGAALRRGDVDQAFWEELEEILVGADVGVATTAALLGAVRAAARRAGAKQRPAVREILRAEMVARLERPPARGRLWGAAAPEPERPHVILVVGVNGAGKTTSIAKLAAAYRAEGRSVILGAGDTFRAAATEQLQAWGRRLDVPVIAGQAGGDPGAVAYDTVSAALARGADLAIIDTAGRLQTKKNLMAELAKVRRVIAGRRDGAPHEVLLVLDATTGQNGLSQARVFAESTQVTAICLAKLDGSAKGGIAFAVADELGIPVRFVGTGERAADLAPFDARAFVEALFVEA